MCSAINQKKTFDQLYNSGYVPFTFAEFQGTDPIEKTEISLIKGSDTLITGTVSEADRSFAASQTAVELNWTDIFSAKITSNYGLVDVYLIVKDHKGNEVYKHAVRTATAGNMSLTMAETGAGVTTWVTQKPVSGKVYNAELVVQLATGERTAVWQGSLTYDK